MKLDATDLRYVTPDEFRVLGTVETLSRSHLSVPVTLIAQHLATHKGNGSVSVGASGGIQKCLGSLAKRGLVGKVMGVKYDGYRLTYGGFDFLALRAFSRRTPIPSISSVGQRVGVGKEGDVYIVKGKGKGPMMVDPEDEQEEDITKRAGYGLDEEEEDEMRVLKMHRLGRISFRKIKEKRDYLGQRKSASWMYMSKLAAEKEFAFMKVLHEHGFPVPKPYDQSRHSIVMSYIDGLPLRSVTTTSTPPSDLFAKLMSLVVRLAQHGLIHGDFNEFNLMIREDNGEPMVIDFPQMVSVRHANAEHFFNRDVQCVRKFFRKRFRFESTEYPTWRSIRKTLPLGKVNTEEEGDVGSDDSDKEEEEEEIEEFEEDGKRKVFPRLDLLVEASGFNRNMQNELEQYMNEVAEMSDDSELSELSEDEDVIEDEDDEDDEDNEDLQGQTAKLTLKGAVEDSDSDGSSSDSSSAPPLVPASTAGGRTNITSRTDTTSGGTRASSKHPKDESLRDVVTSDLAKQRIRTESKHHKRKGVNGAGKAPGHKWKSSTATKVGKTTGDGW